MRIANSATGSGTYQSALDFWHSYNQSGSFTAGRIYTTSDGGTINDNNRMTIADADGNDVITFKNKGNVGIGINNPGYRLQIMDPSKTNTPLVIGRGSSGPNSNLPNTFGYPYVRIGGYEYDAYYTNLTKQTIGFGFANSGGYAPAEMGVEITNWADYGTADLVMATRANTGNSIPQERMRIKSNGNIGIGTNAPAEKLSIEGNISANGYITTKKLTVTQIGWSDYVFNKEYKLRSLSSLEPFIKQNKHLPEMPSAKEVESQGISVGDNQALLLKKIEELTLYLIQVNKKIDQLKTENQKLKSRRP